MKTTFAQMSKYKYPFYILLHPFDGFQEMKYNKKGSLPFAAMLVFLWYVFEVTNRSMTDFAFNPYRADKLDLRMIALTTIAVFLVAVISNWCFSTFMDGKGSLKDIFIAGAYCLIPIIFATVITTVLSQALVLEEKSFLTYITIVGQLWTALLIVAAVAQVHDFNIGQTVAMIFLTALGMLIMLFLGFLVYSLVQQVIMFVMNFTYELIYRITMH
ncbi:MAG: YIP1 family protein [Clostridia bacterium]|nr:YIP1 family protein [Clostridia bacterium]